MVEINKYAKEQIYNIKKICERIQPLVVIHCITYNHESYIRDTLDGFVMQKTDFTFVAIVHEDGSTDKTAEIIKEYAEKYPNIILPIFEKENQYSKGTLSKIMDEACKATGAKYIAWCEGDDYWTDSLKLQKQVNTLENNLDYSACLTKFISYKDSTKSVYALIGNDYSSLFDMLWRDLQFGTATLMLRTELYYNYLKDIEPEKKNWLMGDKPMVLYMATKGRVKTISDVTAVYRILESSASHSNSTTLQLKRARNTIDIYHYFAQRYLQENERLKRKIEGGYLYRGYLIYSNSNCSLPNELRNKIMTYNGDYSKIKIVKILLTFPFLHKLVYLLVNWKNKLLSRF